MTTTKHIYSLLFFCIITLNLLAQNTDTGLWLSIQSEKELNKKTDLETELSSRWKNDMNTFYKFLVENTLKHKFSKSWRFAISYRYSRIYDNTDNFFYNNHRFSGGLRYLFKINSFKMYLQSKFQYGIEKDFDYINNRLKTKTYLRNKFNIQYNIKKSPFTPYASVEFFTPLFKNNSKQFEIDTYRILSGCKYKINKSLSLKGFLMYENEYHDSGNEKMIIGGLSFSFKW